MSTIVTRADKGSPLTNTEVDANFTNLNTDKAETDGATLTNVDINSGTIDGVTIGGASAGAITGTTITGTSFVSSGDMTFGDNDKAIFGAGSDLQIYHSGINSFISDASGTGFINIRSNAVRLASADGLEILGDFIENGAVILYHNNSSKLATTSTGIDVTGAVTADGLTVDGEIILDSATGNHFLKFYRSDSTINAGNALGQILFGGSDEGDFPDAASIQASAATNWGATSSATQLDFFTTRNTTVTPVKRLTVADSGDISFYEDTGTSQNFYWDASTSRLGLGTTSPQSLLHLIGTPEGVDTQKIYIGEDATRGMYVKYDGLANDGIIGGLSTFHYDVIKFPRDGTNIRFNTSGSEAMRIDSSGRLGINTTTPSTELTVNGTITETSDSTDYNIVSQYDIGTEPNEVPINALLGSMAYQDAEGVNIDELVVNQNLGIGTTSPASPLQVDRASTDGDIVTLSKDETTVGLIGTNANGNFQIYNATAGHTGIQFGTGEIAPISNSGALTDNFANLGRSAHRFKDLYLSGGVYLGGTGSANLLDDYEEGDWTPQYAIVGGSFSAIAYNTFSGGSFTKIGNMVTLVGYIATNSFTIGTGGNLVISGLPFTPLDTTGLSERSAVSIGIAEDWAASGFPISGRLQGGTSAIFLQKRTSVDGTTSAVQASDMGITSQDNQLSFSVVYFT